MPVNYQNAKVYTILNTENEIAYVGSTAQKLLSTRMVGHRHAAQTDDSFFYTAMRTIGVDKFRIVLHHAFPCQSKDELVAEEYRTMDLLLASGKQLYNDWIDGKASTRMKKKMTLAKLGHTVAQETKQKISAALAGRKLRFSYGSLQLRSGTFPIWIFQYTDEAGKRHSQSFAVSKYGSYGALFRAEEARRAIYPEWGNDEDIYCDDLGHIEWD